MLKKEINTDAEIIKKNKEIAFLKKHKRHTQKNQEISKLREEVLKHDDAISTRDRLIVACCKGILNKGIFPVHQEISEFDKET